MLPILSPVLGLLWLDHSYAIRGMGDYINTRLRPTVAQLANGPVGLLGWEDYLDDHERHHRVLRFVPLGTPIGILFAGLPIASLVYLTTHLEAVWGWGLWSLGALLTLAFVAMWMVLLLTPYGGGRSSASPTSGAVRAVPAVNTFGVSRSSTVLIPSPAFQHGWMSGMHRRVAQRSDAALISELECRGAGDEPAALGRTTTWPPTASSP